MHPTPTESEDTATATVGHVAEQDQPTSNKSVPGSILLDTQSLKGANSRHHRSKMDTVLPPAQLCMSHTTCRDILRAQG